MKTQDMMPQFKKFFKKIIWLGIFIAFPHYALAQLEVPNFVKDLCKKGNLEFCSPKEEENVKKEKPLKFTESEKQILTRLLEREKKLNAKEIALNRREQQLISLENDIKRQIQQLEKLQRSIQEDIDRKKIIDNEQFNKTVSFYERMEVGRASQSLASLKPEVAVKILIKLKEKTSAAILSQMEGAQSAKLIEMIASKQ